MGSGAKTGFCFLDVVTYNLSLPNAPQTKQYTGCGTRASRMSRPASAWVGLTSTAQRLPSSGSRSTACQTVTTGCASRPTLRTGLQRPATPTTTPAPTSGSPVLRLRSLHDNAPGGKFPEWAERKRRYYAIHHRHCVARGRFKKINLDQSWYEQLTRECDSDPWPLCFRLPPGASVYQPTTGYE